MDLNVLVNTTYVFHLYHQPNFRQIHGTGFFLPWHRLYVQTFEDLLRSKCGYFGVHPYWDWTIGNTFGPRSLNASPNPKLDAPDFYHATILSNSTFDGVGSWGDPQNDFQIFTGAFQDIEVAYPVPHHIRRNFTLQPFLGGVSFPGAPSIAVDPTLMINVTFSAANVNFTVNSFTGDYISFQTYLENVGGPHPGPHIILGGDMSGLCPFGMVPPACTPGMKWSSNGECGVQ